MNTLYLKESKNLDSIQNIQLIKGSTQLEGNTNKIKLVYNEDSYEVENELQEGIDVYGYIEVSKKENKKHNVKLEDVRASVDNRIAVEKKQKGRKIVGYIMAETIEDDIVYVALVKDKVAIMPILLLGAAACLLLMCTAYKPTVPVDTKNPTPTPSFKTGDKGTGDLGKEKIEFAKQPTFRMKLNCTPVVENGYMNLRLESPAEDNEGLGFVVKVYLLQKVENGEVIENYSEEPVQIYESPIIYANENIENCPLDVLIDSGIYKARAVYDIYDTENNFLGQVASKLDIKAN